MSTYYLDASALVKRYATERGSAWILSLTDPAVRQAILLSEITLAEVAAALAAKWRAPAGLTADEYTHALGRFLMECDQHYLLLQTSRDIIDLAVDLTQRHRLRGYDAVQLATALVANQDLIAANYPPLICVAADHDLLAAAAAEGLQVANPLDH